MERCQHQPFTPGGSEDTLKRKVSGSSHRGSAETNLTASMRTQVQSLALLSELRIWHGCELWCRRAAAAPIQLLAWEPPYAAGEALKRQKDNNQKKKGGGTSELQWDLTDINPSVTVCTLGENHTALG